MRVLNFWLLVVEKYSVLKLRGYSGECREKYEKDAQAENRKVGVTEAELEHAASCGYAAAEAQDGVMSVEYTTATYNETQLEFSH